MGPCTLDCLKVTRKPVVKHEFHRQIPQRHRATGDTAQAAETLEAYNYGIVDGPLAKMILDMFAREQAHRHEWERQALKTHSFSSILGQVLGFVIAVAIFVSAATIGPARQQGTVRRCW